MTYYTLCDECQKKGNAVGYLARILDPDGVKEKCGETFKPLPNRGQAEADVCPDYISKEM